MFIRFLALATLLVAGHALAADSDSPLVQERGKSRPLVIIAPSSVDPDLVKLKKALEEPSNKEGFSKRNMVLFTIVNLMGQRDGRNLDSQATMALIRDLKLGAGGAKLVLVGKDGEKKLESPGYVDPKELFSLIDQMPMAEKEAVAAQSAPAPEPTPTKGKAGGKGSKNEPPPGLDD